MRKSAIAWTAHRCNRRADSPHSAGALTAIVSAAHHIDPEPFEIVQQFGRRGQRVAIISRSPAVFQLVAAGIRCRVTDESPPHGCSPSRPSLINKIPKQSHCCYRMPARTRRPVLRDSSRPCMPLVCFEFLSFPTKFGSAEADPRKDSETHPMVVLSMPNNKTPPISC
jgi:hypothetical protein